MIRSQKCLSIRGENAYKDSEMDLKLAGKAFWLVNYANGQVDSPPHKDSTPTRADERTGSGRTVKYTYITRFT